LMNLNSVICLSEEKKTQPLVLIGKING